MRKSWDIVIELPTNYFIFLLLWYFVLFLGHDLPDCINYEQTKRNLNMK